MQKELNPLFLDMLKMPEGKRYIRFLHHTSKENIAQIIIKQGFKYYDSFYKTTDEIIIDPVYLNYWFQLRRPYGKYAVVIIIAEEIIDRVNELIKKYGNKLTDNFNVLSECFPTELDDDYQFTLSSHFIRGYYNIEEDEIVFNPNFDAHFFSHHFLENIEFLKNNP
jgi:hypothetical protein